MQERTQHQTPFSGRSECLYVSVVSPVYSVFSGLATETLILLEDRSVGRVVWRRIHDATPVFWYVEKTGGRP